MTKVDTLNRHVAANIRAEVARRGMLQSELADRLNLTRPTVSQILNGTTAITLDRLEQIADVLQVDAAALVVTPAGSIPPRQS